MELSQIKNALAARAVEVCQHLLPEGKHVKNEWQGGRLADGQGGNSLNVVVSGDKVGIWKDFGGDVGGSNLLELWVQAKGLAFQTALAEAREWLTAHGAIRAEPLKAAREKAYSKPSKEGITWIANQAEFYLLTDRRIPKEIIKLYRVAMTDGSDGKPTALVFPYMHHDKKDGKHETQMIKYLALERDERGKKNTWTSANTPKVLFGKHTVRPEDRYIILTEGEIDAMSYRAMGLTALSVPFGAKWEGANGRDPNEEWIENDWDFLQRFERIYLSMDMDEEGRKAQASLIKRLGQEVCFVIELKGAKDANELLKAGKGAELEAAFKAAKTIDPEALKNTSEFREQVLDRMYQQDEETARGIPLPFGKQPFHIRWNEWTCITGQNGSGKALSLDTPILTLGGWKMMEAIRPGDTVFDKDGKQCSVVATTEVQHDRKCYKVTFSDGYEIIADGAHEWLTETQLSLRTKRASLRAKLKRVSEKRFPKSVSQRGVAKIRTTEEIRDSLVFSLPAGQRINNHCIQACGALLLEERLLPIHPYVLGAWLGDGDSQLASIYGIDLQIFDEIRSCGYIVLKNRLKEADSISYLVKGLTVELRKANLLKNKHIPREYFSASVQQRMELLQGLMDTDGTCGKKGHCELVSVFKPLADDVLELCLSLGIIAKMYTHDAKLYGRYIGKKYRIMFTTDLPVFRLQRKLDRIPKQVSTRVKYRWIVGVEEVPSVPVKCIQVDSADHTYLAGRTLIPTHNSQIIGWLAIYLAGRGHHSCIASLEVPVVQTLQSYVAQVTGEKVPPRELAEKALDWMAGKFWFYDVVGSTTIEKLLLCWRYAYRRHGVRVFVADSWMRLGIKGDDFDQQAVVLNLLSSFVMEFPVHVFLVVHPRKAADASKVVGKMDVKGSGEITDQAHNVLTMWRNEPKERKMETMVKMKEEESLIDALRRAKPDAVLMVGKQRNDDGDLPHIDLWFIRTAKQFFHFFRDKGVNTLAEKEQVEPPPEAPASEPLDEDVPF